MAKVLITGGAGFIGLRVAQELLSKGHEVRIFDIVKRQIEGVDAAYTGSILDPYELSHAMRGCDYVCHLAAALGVKRTETKRLECLFINIQGTINVLETAVKEGIKKVLFTSSSEVYGDQEKQPLSEESPLYPKSNYAVTKIAGEEYVKTYSQTYGLDYSIVRFFNVYGPHQSDSFVITRFIKAVFNNEPPVIYGTGRQVRSFCYVDDAARGVVKALFSPKANSEIFNIGNDTEPTMIKDLAKKIIALSGRKLKSEFVHMRRSDRNPQREILKRIPCIKKAAQVINYKPQVGLDKGLRLIIDFYSAQNAQQKK